MSLEDSQFHVEILDKLTKKEFQIVRSLLIIFKSHRDKKYKYSYPSIPFIAKIAKCCPRTVNTFIKKYEGIVFTHKNRKNAATGKNLPNLYKYNVAFFETLILLEFHHYLHDWKKYRKKVHLGFMNNADFLNEKTIKVLQLSTDKLRAENLVKLRCINSYINSSKNIVLKEEVPSTGKEKRFGILQGEAISYQQKSYLSHNFSPESIYKSVMDLRYVKSKENVANIGGFLYKKAREHTIKGIQQTQRRLNL